MVTCHGQAHFKFCSAIIFGFMGSESHLIDIFIKIPPVHELFLSTSNYLLIVIYEKIGHLRYVEGLFSKITLRERLK